MPPDPLQMTLAELAGFVRALEQRWDAREATIPAVERHTQQLATMRAIQARLDVLIARLDARREENT